MKNSDYSRQSFLGISSQELIQNAVVGVVGLGGGGSHVAQQLAHLGFLNYVLIDPDFVEKHNLNRLIGGTAEGAANGEKKTDSAKRLILGIRPYANIADFNMRWQDCANALRRCDFIFGAVDGFDQRRQLESFCRRFLIPLIDIGMDVAWEPPEPPQVIGQVILSMPGCACMKCIGFLNDKNFAREAAAYGKAGPRPQVVWPNGVLASTAVGIAVDLLTDFSQSLRSPPYLSYRGNTFGLGPHPRVPFLDLMRCPHYQFNDLGPPRIKML